MKLTTKDTKIHEGKSIAGRVQFGFFRAVAMLKTHPGLGRPFRASLMCDGPIPRAALRSALGYHVSALQASQA